MNIHLDTENASFYTPSFCISVHGVMALFGQKISGNSLIRIDAVFNRICFSAGISHTKTLLYWFLVENIIVVLTIFPIALLPAGWLSDIIEGTNTSSWKEWNMFNVCSCLKRDVIVGLTNEWRPMSVHFSKEETVSFIYSTVCCFQELKWNTHNTK